MLHDISSNGIFIGGIYPSILRKTYNNYNKMIHKPPLISRAVIARSEKQNI